MLRNKFHVTCPEGTKEVRKSAAAVEEGEEEVVEVEEEEVVVAAAADDEAAAEEEDMGFPKSVTVSNVCNPRRKSITSRDTCPRRARVW